MKPSSPKAVSTDPAAVPESARNPTGSRPDAPSGNTRPTKPRATKGKGPCNEISGKAPASKLQLSAAALGVQERTRSTLFGVATLVQVTGTEEDTVRCLENYTGLLTGLQKLVVTMASGYEAATEDVRSLVASTLDVATQRDRTFVAGASQALADWTAKYQHAMSQGENQLMHNQLAHWDRVREVGIALSRHITTLTTEHGQSTASAEIFLTLLPECFQRVRVRTEATFSKVNATLPSLLCRFMAPDEAGQIMASIFTCLCNYNTEICRMAMAQTVVPVYTIPNTYRVQQSLWESLCQIIPGVAHTGGSELRSFEPVAPVTLQWGSPIWRRAPDALAIPELGTLDWVIRKMSQFHCPPARRMLLRKHASPAFRMEFLRLVPIGPCLNNTYQLSILPTTEILLMPVHQKPALPSKLLRNLGDATPRRSLMIPKYRQPICSSICRTGRRKHGEALSQKTKS